MDTNSNLGAPFLDTNCALRKSGPPQTRDHYAIVEPAECLLQVLKELGSILVAYNPLVGRSGSVVSIKTLF
jgi:hypothetical protein